MYESLEIGSPLTFNMEDPAMLILMNNSQLNRHCFTNQFKCTPPLIDFSEAIDARKHSQRGSSYSLVENMDAKFRVLVSKF